MSLSLNLFLFIRRAFSILLHWPQPYVSKYRSVLNNSILVHPFLPRDGTNSAIYTTHNVIVHIDNILMQSNTSGSSSLSKLNMLLACSLPYRLVCFLCLGVSTTKLSCGVYIHSLLYIHYLVILSTLFANLLRSSLAFWAHFCQKSGSSRSMSSAPSVAKLALEKVEPLPADSMRMTFVRRSRI